jgi:hypothetical protein
MEHFRRDLLAVEQPLRDATAELQAAGFMLTPVRALELLVWTETEPQGYYRDVVTPPLATTTPVVIAGDVLPASPVEAQLHAWAAEFAR